MEQSMTDLIAVGGTLLGSVLLGAVKRFTTVLDGKVGALVKPIQPVLVMAAGVGLPFLANLLGVSAVPDASTFIAAPTATVLAVALRELKERARRIP